MPANTHANSQGLISSSCTSLRKTANFARTSDIDLSELTPDYEYLANLYAKAGVTQQSKNPVIFGEIVFSTETKEIFKIVPYPEDSVRFQHGPQSGDPEAQICDAFGYGAAELPERLHLVDLLLGRARDDP